jgi:hypothetical protein
VNSLCELWVAHENGTRRQITSGGALAVPNNTYLVAVNSTGTGTVNIVRCTTGNTLEFLGSVLIDGTGNVTVPGSIDLEGDIDVNGTAEVDAITLAGAATNAAGGLMTTVMQTDTFVLNNDDVQTTTSSATVEFGATDYVEIVSPNAADEVLVWFIAPWNTSSSSSTESVSIQENSSGSYGNIAHSVKTYDQYGDGTTTDPFFTMARITGKSATYRIQAAISVTASATLSVWQKTMIVQHVKRRV